MVAKHPFTPGNNKESQTLNYNYYYNPKERPSPKIGTPKEFTSFISAIALNPISL